jgi:hypothetical protein
MKIGVISEGHSDRAVILNIVTGATGLDSSDIETLRPVYTKDETDKSLKDPKSFSSWSVVKEECKNRELIDTFLSIEGQDFVIIHLDSAECADYGVQRSGDKLNLRDLIINEINSWLSIDLSGSILYAIAIEEIDAWVLTIYEKKDSTTSARPKERLSRELRKNKINSTQTFDNYLVISKILSKTKELERSKCLSYNHSLAAFYEEIKSKVLPKL